MQREEEDWHQCAAERMVLHSTEMSDHEVGHKLSKEQADGPEHEARVSRQDICGGHQNPSNRQRGERKERDESCASVSKRELAHQPRLCVFAMTLGPTGGHRFVHICSVIDERDDTEERTDHSQNPVMGHCNGTRAADFFCKPQIKSKTFHQPITHSLCCLARHRDEQTSEPPIRTGICSPKMETNAQQQSFGGSVYDGQDQGSCVILLPSIQIKCKDGGHK
mmetsp:Transcript_30555/g.51619  ORF Transcript_30555/g.51619 Transcript_30555/m.51619 type:complete len:222 (+) Transcript_30555:1888-2553(+)